MNIVIKVVIHEEFYEQCEECGNCSFNRNHLKTHIRRMHGVSAQFYEQEEFVQDCQPFKTETFSNAFVLDLLSIIVFIGILFTVWLHLEAFISEECEMCDKEANILDHLKTRKRTKHENLMGIMYLENAEVLYNLKTL